MCYSHHSFSFFDFLLLVLRLCFHIFAHVSYRVFARKYRPQTFEEVIGQDSITTVLKNAIRLNRLAQAYLFVGPRGIGKTSTARILAKALNCKNGPTPEPCGMCDSCVEIAESRSLDVLEIDGASHNGVENVRELRETVSFSPARGPFKIYIIDEVHMLTSGAFNALLKTLEEPPPHVKFIFATTEAQKVPATISSRCQRFELKRISPQLMASHLERIASKEKIILEQNAALAIATAADGALRDAESMLDQVVAFCGNRVTEHDVLSLFGLTPQQVVIDLSALVLEKKTAEALALVAEQVANGRDLGRLLTDWIAWLRDILIQQAVANKAMNAALQSQAALIPQGKLLELLDLLAETHSRMKWSSDPQLQMDVAIIKAAHLLEQANLDDVLTTLSHLASGSPLPVSPSPALAPSPATAPTTLASPHSAAPPSSQPPAVPNAPSLLDQKKNPLQRTEPGLSQTDTVSEEPPAAAFLWDTICAKIIQESPFKFGWLNEGKDVIWQGNTTLHVCFPQVLKTQFESVFWGDTQKLLEKQLSKKRGAPISLQIQLIDAPLQERTASPKKDPPPVHPSLLSPSPPTPHFDPIKIFKDDPLIRKALEIFKGTIQTTSQ